MDDTTGIEARAGEVALRATASEAGAIRIEAWRGADAPERASWATLPALWHRDIALARPAPHRFETDLLVVDLDPATLAVRVADRAGRVLLADHPRDPLASDDPGWRLRKHAPAGTQYYGLGDKPGTLAKRGHAYAMWNTDAYGFGESWDPLYKSIPFLIGVDAEGHAWGLFVDTTHRSGFDLAATSDDALAIATPAPALRYHVLAGPRPADVLRRFTDLVGRAPLPPLWSLGYGQCRYSYESAARAVEIVRRHREHAIPLDALWLDIGFQSKNRPYTTDPETFPDLRATAAAIAAEGARTVVIADLHVPVAPGEHYAPYDGGIAGDHFVHDRDGARYVGKVWPGPCHFPDFTRAASRAWWGEQAAGFVADGIAGFWNDMNEPAVFDGPGHTMPLDVRHRIEEPGFVTRVAEHAEIHNVYGMQNARATHDGLLALRPDRRPYVMTRASYAGGHRYAVTWTGDNTSTWNHLRLSTPQLLSLGLSGFGLAGCDIGGFKGSPSPDLLTQWIATGVFNPLFRNHTDLGSRDQEADVHGPEHETLRRRAINGRYRLMPYLYTAVEEMTRTGLPVMRPLFVDFPDAALRLVETAFMFGPSLLVAPPPDETLDLYDVVLPQGTSWFDYWSGLPVEPKEDGTITVPRRLGHVPVLVRAGAILPLARTASSTATRGGSLRLHVFPAPDASGQVYDDDGESFAYRDGGFHRRRFRYEDGTLRLDAPEGGHAPYWRHIRVVVHGVAAPRAVTLEDGTAVAAEHDALGRTLRFRVPADTRVVRLAP